MRFEIFRTDNVFTFQLLDDTRQILLTGGTQPSVEACVESVRGFVQAAASRPNYTILPGDGTAVFAVLDGGRELARSIAYGSPDEAGQAADTLAANMAGTSDHEVAYAENRTQSVQLPVPTVNADIYDFAQASQSGNMGFEPFQGKDRLYFFHFNHTDGTALLFSQGYTSEATRDNGIRSTIRNSTKEERYEAREENGRHFFILTAVNGRELARSAAFASRAEMEKAMAFLNANATGFADAYRKPEKTRVRSGNPPVDKYNFNAVPGSGQSGFEPFQSVENKQHYFHFNDENARPILFSQGYNNVAGRDNGIRAVIRNAYLEVRYLRKQEDGQHYFTLKSANSQEVARSPLFGSAMEMEAAIDYLKGQSVTFAEKYQVGLRTAESPDIQTRTFNIHVNRPVAGVPTTAGLSGNPREIPSIEPPQEMPPTEEPRINPAPDAPSEIPPVREPEPNPMPDTPREIPGPAEPTIDPAIPPVVAKAKKPPLAMDVVNGAIPGRAGAVHIKTLTGRPINGRIVSYTVTQLPPAERGTLLNNGTPVVAGQAIDAAEAARLKFDPNGDISGETGFLYKATDENGLESSVAKFTIPIMKAPPQAKDVVFGTVKPGAGAVTINPLAATAKESEIEKYIITALPPANQGVLLLDGSEVQAQQELVPSAADRLRFRPGKEYTGKVMFKYKAIDGEGVHSNTASYTIKMEKAAAAVAAIPPVKNAPRPAKSATPANRAAAPRQAKPAGAAKTMAAPRAATPAATASKGRAGWLWAVPVAILAVAGIWYFAGRNPDMPVPMAAQGNIAQPAPAPEPVVATQVPATMEDFQPIALYFDNDHPDPRTQTDSTNLTYGQTYDAYYGLRTNFADEFGKGLAATEAKNAKKEMGGFFDGKVKKGHEDLMALSGRLLEKLKAGSKVEITVTGFASPLATGEYNKMLTSRRVGSIENHFRTYGNGQFKNYMDNRMLVVTEAASGEEASRQGISDDLADTRRSQYSPEASAERRVKITNVTVAKPQ